MSVQMTNPCLRSGDPRGAPPALLAAVPRASFRGRGHLRWAPRLAGLFAAALLSAGGTAPAGAREGARIPQAEALAAEGRCDEAVPLLREALADRAGDAPLHRLLGQCLIRLQDFAGAAEALAEARRLDPDLAEVDLYLGMARFHLGDLEGAEEAIERAVSAEPGRAEALLYRGLLRLQRGEYAAAADALEAARRSDPETVEPVASYYLGLARAAAGDREAAEEALDRVIRIAPGTSWARQARSALDRAERALPARFWAEGGLGFEYDNNVVLKGAGVVLPQDISNQRDVRLAWTLEGGAYLLRTPRWTGGAVVRYYGSGYQDLHAFEVHYPTLTLWADRRLGERTTWRGEYEGGYAWVDKLPFLSQHSFTTSLHRDFGAVGRSRALASYYRYNYHFDRGDDVPDGTGVPGAPCPGGEIVCGPPGIDERDARNRDGQGFTLGVDHWLPVDLADLEIQAGYRFQFYSSRGREYSFTGHEIRLGGQVHLPFDLGLTAQGRYLYKPFRHVSTFPDPRVLPRQVSGFGAAVLTTADFVNLGEYALVGEKRRDNVFAFDASLERRLTESLSASLRYSHVRNRSNTPVYDYRREVLGAWITFRFRGG